MTASLPKSIAVVGGGPCGVLTASALRERFPAASITLFEREAKVGGNASSLETAGRRIDLSVKLLPISSFDEDGFYSPLRALVARYDTLVRFGPVRSRDFKAQRYLSSPALPVSKAKLLRELIAGFDCLYEVSRCASLSEVLALGIARADENILEFGRRTGLPNLAYALAYSMDLFGFSVVKRDLPAAYVLWSRCFYGVGLYEAAFSKPAARKLARLLVRSGAIRLRHQAEFERYLDKPKETGTYWTLQGSIDAFLSRLAEDACTQVVTGARIDAVTRRAGGFELSLTGPEGAQTSGLYDDVVLCVPNTALTSIAVAGVENPIAAIARDTSDHRVSLNAYLLDLARNEETAQSGEASFIATPAQNVTRCGQPDLDTSGAAITGFFKEERDLLVSLQYEGVSVGQDASDRGHREALTAYGVSVDAPVSSRRFTPPPMFSKAELAAGALSSIERLNARRDLGLTILNEAVCGSGLVPMFKAIESTMRAKYPRESQRPRKISILGASADCGFMNRFTLGDRIGWSEAARLLSTASFHLLPSLAAARGALWRSRRQRRQQLRETMVDFLHEHLGDGSSSIFRSKIESIASPDTVVNDLSRPGQSVALAHRTVLEGSSLDGTELFFIHLGGNDFVDRTELVDFEARVESLFGYLGTKFRSSRFVVVGLHDIPACVLDEEHLRRTAVVLPWGATLTVRDVQQGLGLRQKLERDLGRVGRAALEGELRERTAILRRAAEKHLANHFFLENSGYRHELSWFSWDGFHPSREGCLALDALTADAFARWMSPPEAAHDAALDAAA